MTHYVFGVIVTIVLLAGSNPGWCQQYYLYAPKALDGAAKVQRKNGILVQEIPIRKGDTLYDLSRKFSGHGFYYPQILLFNNIKDPDKIYTGSRLKVPVSRRGVPDRIVNHHPRKSVPNIPSAGPVKERSTGVLKKSAVAGGKKRALKHKTDATARTQARTVTPPAVAVAATSEQRQFEQAIKAYRKDDYRTALELFDRFLADYPSSTLAADASLYKADCYLKQSSQ